MYDAVTDTPPPTTPSWRGFQFKKHMDNFTFTFMFNADGVSPQKTHNCITGPWTKWTLTIGLYY
jgi:hypothetical protein